MRNFYLILIFLCSVTMINAQGKSDIQKLVDTEHSFAAFAAEHDAKSAFFEFIAPYGVLFQPDKVDGREYWTARGPSKGLLSWAPNYADISTNGILGYTTGNWEYRQVKDDVTTAFGDFITVWLRQPDGKYKFVVDIGVGHEKPTQYSNDWVTTADKAKDPNEKNTSAADVANGFFELATKQSLKKAFEVYAADDIRLYREGKMPILGKKSGIKAVSVEKGGIVLAKKSSFMGSTNLSYTISTYTRTEGGKVFEKGNYMQLWKLKVGKWVIVLDIFKAVSQK